MRSWAFIALTALLTACSTSSPRAATPPTSTSTASPTPINTEITYISAVNSMCGQLQTQEQHIVTSFPPHFPVKDFLRDTTQIQPLLADFDDKLSQLHATPQDEPAARAFAAYVRESTADRQQRVLAAQQSQAAYDAEYDRQDAAYASDPILTKIDELGFSGSCHYR